MKTSNIFELYQKFQESNQTKGDLWLVASIAKSERLVLGSARVCTWQELEKLHRGVSKSLLLLDNEAWIDVAVALLAPHSQLYKLTAVDAPQCIATSRIISKRYVIITSLNNKFVDIG